jgi:hypothetical protein
VHNNREPALSRFARHCRAVRVFGGPRLLAPVRYLPRTILEARIIQEGGGVGPAVELNREARGGDET